MKKSIVLTIAFLLLTSIAFTQDTSPAWVDETTNANATNIAQNIHRHGRVGIGTPFGPISGMLHIRHNNPEWMQGIIVQNDGGGSIITQLGKKNGVSPINWLRFTDNSALPKTWAFIHDNDNNFRLENEITGVAYLRPFIVEWAAPTNAFYMKSNGSIGINTNTPQSDAKLHVKGNRMVLEGEGATDQDFAPVIDFKFAGRSDYWSMQRKGATWANANEANNLKFGFYNGSSWVNTLRMDPNGHAFFYNSVGIGLNTADMPGKNTDYRLFVEKGILTEKLKITVKNSAFWADYVFNDDYCLMPLNEVENFIKNNHHLPGIPSANQVVKEGVDVAAMDAKLLEKIEELTLHLIQMKKENDDLKKRLETLEQR